MKPLTSTPSCGGASGIKSIDMDISTANELLLSLLRGTWDESALRELPEADWNCLVRQARRHALEPLLCQQLKTRHQAVPAAVLRDLQAKYFACAWRNNSLYQELEKVLNALREQGIPVILLKGAHLVKIIYGNIALRSVGDVDILVRKNDLPQARKTLLKLGYRSSKEEDVETACAGCHHLLPLMKEDAAPVELHWTFELAFAIDHDGLWERARPVMLADADVLVLSPEDLLLHLCLHSAYHHLYENGLRAFCDIRETIRHHRDELDWETALRRARQWGAGNSVYLTLHLAKELLGAEVPAELLARHKPDSFSPQLAAEAEKMIFRERGMNLFHQPHLTKLLNSMSALDTARLFLQRIFLSRKELADRYSISPNSPYIFLHYPLRLKDMIARHGRTVLQLCWRRDEAAVRQLRLIDWLGR